MESMLTSYGSGYGSGDGSGSGSGYGYGYGDGYGCGYGYGEKIGEIVEHAVSIICPFRVVIVGCQAHTIEHWREHWREIAEEHNMAVDESAVAVLFSIVDAMLRDCEEE